MEGETNNNWQPNKSDSSENPRPMNKKISVPPLHLQCLCQSDIKDAFDVAQVANEMDELYCESFTSWIRNPVMRECIGHRLAVLSAYHPIPQLVPILQWVSEGWSLSERIELLRCVCKNWSLESKFYLWNLMGINNSSSSSYCARSTLSMQGNLKGAGLHG